MIEEKLKIAAQELPKPQSTFKNILERAAPNPKSKYLEKELASRFFEENDE